MFLVQELNFFDLMGDQMQETPRLRWQHRALRGHLRGLRALPEWGRGSRPAFARGRRQPASAQDPNGRSRSPDSPAAGPRGTGSGKSAEAFYAEVEAVLDVVESAWNSTDSEFMRHQLKRMTAPAARTDQSMASAAGDMQLGLHQMLSDTLLAIVCRLVDAGSL